MVLRAGFMKMESLNVHDYQVYKGDTAWFIRDFEKFIAAMTQDIEKFKPHTVILSAEQMFRDFSSSSKVPLSSFLSEYFSDVQIVVYIKSPIAHYLSSLAQSLRVGVDNLRPRLNPIKTKIEYFEGQFPGRVRLHAFDKKQLLNADVLNDFLASYAPEMVSLLADKKTERSNVSLSWPMLIALRKLRMRIQPKGKKPLLETRMTLARFARENKNKVMASPSKKPELKPSINSMLIKSAGDFLWLKKEHGIIFSDLDYGLMGGGSSDEGEGYYELEDILDLSNIPALDIDSYCHDKKGISYYLSHGAFTLRLSLTRIINLYFRGVLSLFRKL